MAADFYLKKGDRQPAIRATLKGADGVAQSLANATVRFKMRVQSGATKVAQPATIANPPGTDGVVSYAWAAADTDTPGMYEAEWEVTFSNGLVQTFPNDRFLIVQIAEDV